jgi:hypothetical protein
MKKTKEDSSEVQPNSGLICGIVMPISPSTAYPAEHWKEVRLILEDCIEEADFEPNMVSDSNESGIIQKRIVQNLYENPIVICDVSGKNPNVMFELGMRLAFDKPTIIVKDDATDYTFDAGPIEHLGYPKDLRFPRMIEFRENLIEKIKATYAKSQSDSQYSTFLKHFGTFKVPKLEKEFVEKDAFIIEELKQIRTVLANIPFTQSAPLSSGGARRERRIHHLCLRDCKLELAEKIKSELIAANFGAEIRIIKAHPDSEDHYHIPIKDLSNESQLKALEIGRKYLKTARYL